MTCSTIIPQAHDVLKDGFVRTRYASDGFYDSTPLISQGRIAHPFGNALIQEQPRIDESSSIVLDCAYPWLPLSVVALKSDSEA